MSQEKEISLSLKNVSKTFTIAKGAFSTFQKKLFNFNKKIEKKEVKALTNININIYKGECIGLIGRNGSGKSTLTKIMSGAYLPDRNGTIIKNGTSLLLNLGVGFSHELTARENIYVNGSTLGLRIKEIDKIYMDIIKFAELDEYLDTKIKYYSTGMIQRLSFSIAVYANADIIFLDEVFAVGDEKFKEKATIVLEENWIKGRTVIIVSHSAGLIQKYCSKTILMNKGEMIYFGETNTAIEKYRAIE
ncbi:MAG: ABC-2 type transport system ATP-binding protein [Vicingaceae bacterium]|jgi:ABC-type polysaccharide/polyol phosphate transport system ATPase subunit